MKMIKLRLVVICIVASVMALFGDGSLAFYSSASKAVNVVTAGDIRLIIHETTGDGSPFPEEGIYVIPGQIVSKRVTIENDCEHPFYLRVKLINGVDNTALSAEDCFSININEKAWTLRDDGYIYANKVIMPGETTEPVFTQIEIVGASVDNSYIGAVLSLSVNAYAVQEENNPAEHPWDAMGWPEERAE